MTLPELAERSLRLLGQIIDQAHEGIPNKLDFASPPEFIYLHARNIRALGKDVLALKAQTQSRGSRILVRSMSESLFALVAAAKDPEFPAGKVIAEQKDQIRRIKMWIGEKPPSEFQEKIEEAKREISDIEQRCPQQKGWQVDHRAGIHRKRQGMTTTLPLRFERGSLCLSRSFHGYGNNIPPDFFALNCLNQTPNTSPAINPAAA